MSRAGLGAHLAQRASHARSCPSLPAQEALELAHVHVLGCCQLVIPATNARQNNHLLRGADAQLVKQHVHLVGVKQLAVNAALDKVKGA